MLKFLIITTKSMKKQVPVCEKCTGWMDSIKDHTLLKCRICGHTIEVKKRIIKALNK